MISKAERQHILTLKQWSAESRATLKTLTEGPLGPILKRFNSKDPDVIFDNVDWLITLIERESHTAGVKGLLAAVEAHEKRK